MRPYRKRAVYYVQLRQLYSCRRAREHMRPEPIDDDGQLVPLERLEEEAWMDEVDTCVSPRPSPPGAANL